MKRLLVNLMILVLASVMFGIAPCYAFDDNWWQQRERKIQQQEQEFETQRLQGEIYRLEERLNKEKRDREDEIEREYDRKRRERIYENPWK